MAKSSVPNIPFQSAAETDYNNATSGLTAVNVQDAVDETVTLIESSDTFIEHADTPPSYVPAAHQFVRVNATEDALVFSTIVEADITDLTHYTSSDFNADFSTKTTSDLTEGTNLYYTEARVSANTEVAANTVHRTSSGVDHTFIDQDVTTTATPKFNGIVRNLSTKTSNYTVATSDDIIECDASAGGFTITLPTAISDLGRSFTIVVTDDSGENIVTVNTNANETINGEISQFLVAKDSMVIVSNGSNWRII